MMVILPWHAPERLPGISECVLLDGCAEWPPLTWRATPGTGWAPPAAAASYPTAMDAHGAWRRTLPDTPMALDSGSCPEPPGASTLGETALSGLHVNRSGLGQAQGGGGSGSLLPSGTALERRRKEGHGGVLGVA